VQLLSPIGLFALSSLIVPILIHLWNVKQGKTLKIGSIALLGESSKLNSKSLKINDWPLFLIRCLLLIVLTIILCNPFLLKQSDISNEKGWIMINKSHLKQVYEDNRDTFDSLLIKGYKVHNFGFGFEELNLKDTVKAFAADTPAIGTLSLLKQLNSLLAKSFPVVLYADKRLNPTGQTLPTLDIDLTWNALNKSPLKITKAVQYGSRAYVGTLSPDFMRFDLMKNTINSEFTHISIFQEANSIDSKYLASALHSIASYRNYKIQVDYATNPSQLRNADLIFWLSSRVMPDKAFDTFKKGAKVLKYAQGKVVNLNSFVSVQTGSQSDADPKLYKRVVANKYSGAAIWSDYQGSPVLTKENFRGHDLYKLYTRFNQNWTNLVWQDQFVRSMVPVVSQEVSAYDDFGYLDVSEDQRLMTTKLPKNEASPTKQVVQTSLVKEPINHLFWILGFCLFCVERFMSYRTGRRVAHE
jgi:hypothetical protein